jgi:hypothetical protein
MRVSSSSRPADYGFPRCRRAPLGCPAADMVGVPPCPCRRPEACRGQRGQPHRALRRTGSNSLEDATTSSGRVAAGEEGHACAGLVAARRAHIAGPPRASRDPAAAGHEPAAPTTAPRWTSLTGDRGRHPLSRRSANPSSSGTASPPPVDAPDASDGAPRTRVARSRRGGSRGRVSLFAPPPYEPFR